MGILAIIIFGLFGAFAGYRKGFSRNWIFLVNLCFSLYAAILLTPLTASLLEIPDLAPGYKNMIALGSIFLLMDYILTKVVEQIHPDPDIARLLPELPVRIGSLIAGFFSGALLAAVIMLCFVQTPYSAGLPFCGGLRSASGTTVLIMVKTMNGLSGQWLDTEEDSQLKALGIVSSEEEPVRKK